MTDYSKESLKAKHEREKQEWEDKLNKKLLEYYEHNLKTKELEQRIHEIRCMIWNMGIGRNRS